MPIFQRAKGSKPHDHAHKSRHRPYNQPSHADFGNYLDFEEMSLTSDIFVRCFEQTNEYRQLHIRYDGLQNRNPLSQNIPVRRFGKPRVCRRYSTAGRDALGLWAVALNFSPETYSKLIRDKRISHGAFRVWHLFRDMTGKNPNCWPSLQTIADEIGCSKPSVIVWAKELISCGYMRVESGNRRRSNRYFLSGSILNHSGSKRNLSGLKSILELNPINRNSMNGRLSPSERISLEKEKEALIKEREAIKAAASYTSLGGYSYTEAQRKRLAWIKDRIAKIDAALFIPL